MGVNVSSALLIGCFCEPEVFQLRQRSISDNSPCGLCAQLLLHWHDLT